ncbi:MAG: hypothetical protein ACUVS1_12120 [Actinomycetota bacterium]
MLDFAHLNSSGDMTLGITRPAIRGDQAAAVVTSADHEVESAAITAKKAPGAGTWRTSGRVSMFPSGICLRLTGKSW